MKITFTQSDVVEALKSHIISQGISLTGKSVDIKFTMKKLGAGVEADVSIDAIAPLPDLSDDETPSAPALRVAADNTVKAAPVAEPEVTAAPAVTEAPTQAVQAEPATATVEPEEALPDAAPAAKTTSLFN